jgi:hypothetical protein
MCVAIFDVAPTPSLDWKCLPPRTVGKAVEQPRCHRIAQEEVRPANNVDTSPLQFAALHHLLERRAQRLQWLLQWRMHWLLELHHLLGRQTRWLQHWLAAARLAAVADSLAALG